MAVGGLINMWVYFWGIKLWNKNGSVASPSYTFLYS
jgi:hypothetical protein